VALSGDNMTGSLTVANMVSINSATTYAQLVMSKAPGATANQILGYTGNSVRWALHLGDTTAESGASTGSDFSLFRYDNAGTSIGRSFSVSRANNSMTVDGLLNCVGQLWSNAGRVISCNGGYPTVTVYDTVGAVASGMWVEPSGVLYFGDMDGSGNAVTGRFYVDRSSNLVANAGVFGTWLQSSGGASIAGRATVNEIMNTSGVFRVANNDAYYMQRSAGDGFWYWVENNWTTMYLRPDGWLYPSGGVAPMAGQMAFGNAGSGRIMQMAPSWYWDWNINDGTIAWQTPSGSSLVIGGDRNVICQAGLFVNGSAIVCQTNCIGITYQSGAYATASSFLFGWSNVVGSLATVSVNNGGAVYAMANASDARLKHNIGASDFDCLDAVSKLSLVEFDWLQVDDPWRLRQARATPRTSAISRHRVRAGLIAQEVAKVLPEAVHAGDDFDDHLGRVWGLDSNVMDAMLIGAIQQLVARNTELAARITQLERRKH